jgi:hypothetical protein
LGGAKSYTISPKISDYVAKVLVDKLRAEGVDAFYTIELNGVEVYLTPKEQYASYSVSLVVESGAPMMVTATQDGSSSHWAKESIEQMARVGIISTFDRNGNKVTVFRPNHFCRRSEGATMLQRFRNYLEGRVSR